MSVSVIIPSFNEELRLPMTLAATAEYFLARQEPFEILVVDDGSTDNTAKVIEEYAKKHPDIKVSRLEYGGNRGKGYAVRFGMLRATGDLRLFCDADLATPAEEYEVVLARMKKDGTEIGIGSRPLRESNLTVHQPWLREYLGRCFNTYVRWRARTTIQDTQCGFKIFSAKAAQDIFSRTKLDGFAFDMEALFIADRLGYKISEVPIRWAHKDGSKVNMVTDGYKMLRDVTMIRRLHRDLRPTAGAIENKV